jgi:hypothetical protein
LSKCGFVFGDGGAKIVQQSSNGCTDKSNVSIFCAKSMISNLSIVATGRMIGVVVTSLMAIMLSSVWEATWAKDSPLKMASPLRSALMASVIRSIIRRVIVIR